MRSTQYAEDVILCLLREAEDGTPIDQVCRSARISTRTFYRWRAQYGGLTSSAARERNDLLHENVRLRALVQELWQRERNASRGDAHPDLIDTRKSPFHAARDVHASGRYASVRGQR